MLHLVIVRGYIRHETLEGIMIGIPSMARHGTAHGIDGGKGYLRRRVSAALHVYMQQSILSIVRSSRLNEVGMGGVLHRID